MSRMSDVVDVSGFLYWDTVEFFTQDAGWDGRGPQFSDTGYSQVKAFAGNNCCKPFLCNLQQAGTLDLDGSAFVRRVLFGLRKAHVASWSECIARVVVGGREVLERPLWYPPDTMHTNDHQAFAEMEDPMDWIFLEWGVEKPLPVHARQSFHIDVVRAGNPVGQMRIAIQGLNKRDIE